MKCNNAQMFFDRMYREGERFNRPDIAAHVGECDHCRRSYATWCTLAKKLADVPPLDAPPALFGNVMRAIDTRRTTGRPQWLFLQWKLPAYGMAFAALVLIAGTSFFITRQQTPEQPVPVASPDVPSLPKDAPTHFEISLANAQQVAIVGDFNGWDKQKHLLIRADATTWKIDLTLPKGCYQYQFLIDGKLWQTDPERKQLIPDGFGGFNTVIEI